MPGTDVFPEQMEGGHSGDPLETGQRKVHSPQIVPADWLIAGLGKSLREDGNIKN